MCAYMYTFYIHTHFSIKSEGSWMRFLGTLLRGYARGLWLKFHWLGDQSTNKWPPLEQLWYNWHQNPILIIKARILRNLRDRSDAQIASKSCSVRSHACACELVGFTGEAGPWRQQGTQEPLHYPRIPILASLRLEPKPKTYSTSPNVRSRSLSKALLPPVRQISAAMRKQSVVGMFRSSVFLGKAG